MRGFTQRYNLSHKKDILQSLKPKTFFFLKIIKTNHVHAKRKIEHVGSPQAVSYIWTWKSNYYLLKMVNMPLNQTILYNLIYTSTYNETNKFVMKLPNKDWCDVKPFISMQSSPSSSRGAASTDIIDPLSPLLPILYCFWEVLRATSCILT